MCIFYWHCRWVRPSRGAERFPQEGCGCTHLNPPSEPTRLYKEMRNKHTVAAVWAFCHLQYAALLLCCSTPASRKELGAWRPRGTAGQGLAGRAHPTPFGRRAGQPQPRVSGISLGTGMSRGWATVPEDGPGSSGAQGRAARAGCWELESSRAALPAREGPAGPRALRADPSE